MKRVNYLSPKFKEFKMTPQKMLCQSPTDFNGYLQDYDVTEGVGDDDFVN